MGSKNKVKEDQERLRTLLSDTVTLLCKNGLSFKKNLKVQGLLGITVDDDEVFIVHVNETLGELVSASDPNQTEHRSPSKTSQSGRKSPKRKRRRRSTDSNDSSQQSSFIDLDPDIEIKTEPDMMVLDQVKCEGPTSERSCQFGDEGLNSAISSISSQHQVFPGNQTLASTFAMPSETVTTSTNQPFITGIVPNVAETSNQSAGSGSFQWDSSSAQGLPGLSSWASQAAQQTMSQSQQPDMSQQPGPSQASMADYSPAQRTGTPHRSSRSAAPRTEGSSATELYIPPPRITHSDTFKRKVVARFMETKNARGTAREFGVSDSTVRDWVKRACIAQQQTREAEQEEEGSDTKDPDEGSTTP